MAKLTVEELEVGLRKALERLEALELGGGVTDHGNSAHSPNFITATDNARGLVDSTGTTTFEVERGAADKVARVKADSVDVMEWVKHSATGLGVARALDLFAFNPPTNLTLDGSGLIEVTQSDHVLVSNSGAEDVLEGLNIGLPSGTWLRLTAITGDKITLKHIGTASARFLLRDGKDAVLDGDKIDTMLFISGGGSFLLEQARSIADEGVSKIFQFPALAEDLATGVMGARPGTNTGEAGEHGDYTLIRATAFCRVVGTGTTTIKIEADSAPDFASATLLFTLDLNTSLEVVDTTPASWPAGDIFLRAECTAVGGTAPKDVNVEVMIKERLFNG